jgi:hypothetical protein
MVLEEQRFIHEDLERLEQGIADRVAEEPRNVSHLFNYFQFFKYMLTLLLFRYVKDLHEITKLPDS